MNANYYETRKINIMERLAAQTLLERDALYNRERLGAFKEFADTLISITSERTNEAILNLRDLSSYIRNQAVTVGLDEDFDITYTTKQIDALSRYIHILETGNKGEKRAKRSLFSIDDPRYVLQNVEIDVDGEPYEIDFVVINRSGIYAIESKCFCKDVTIDADGRFIRNSYDSDSKCKNIYNQMSAQRNAIRSALEKTFGDMTWISESIKSILLNTGDNKIIDVCDRFTILDCDTVVGYLNNCRSDRELTREEMKALRDAIENASHPKMYSINYDYHRVADHFAKAVAKLEATDNLAVEAVTVESDSKNEITDSAEEETTTEETTYNKNSNLGLKIAGGVTATTLALYAGWKLIKKFI